MDFCDMTFGITNQSLCEQMKKIALIVVDIQKDFLLNNEAIKKKAGNDFIANVNQLINVAKHNDINICYTQDEHDSLNSKEFDRFPPHCLRGTDGAQFVDELLPLQGKVFLKTTYSGFWETGLHEYLSSHNIDTIVIIGLQTHICVLSTALNALMLGYNIYIVSDCVVSTTFFRKKTALRWMQRYVGHVIPKDKAIELLSKKQIVI